MNEVSLDKAFLDEGFECMICCEERVCIESLKRCGNKKCTFRMCDKCFDNLQSVECPNCRQPIEGKKLKNNPEEAMTEEHRALVDELESRRLQESRIKLSFCTSMCRVGTTMQIPFWGIGAVISLVLGNGVQYACCYGNVPCTLFLGFEICRDRQQTQAQQNSTALLTRLRDFMESRGSDPSSTSDDNIVVENPLISEEVAPAALVIEDRASS